MKQGQDDGITLDLIPIPKEILQEIITNWRSHDDEEYLLQFADLLGNNRFEFNDIWLFKLTSKCLDMELDHNTNENIFVCPLLVACCRLIKSSIFEFYPGYVDELYTKIILFTQYFEKVFSDEDVETVQIFLEVYCCLKEHPKFKFVGKKHGTNLRIVLRKLNSIADQSIGIPVKRVMMKLIIFFVEESGKFTNAFSADLEEFVNKYPNALRSCGDYEYQFKYSEAVIRISQYFPQQNIVQMLASADSGFPKSFMAINKEAFDESCRMFLNTFNSTESTNLKKVFSLPCVDISFGKIQLKNISNLWVDLNQGSLCMSFRCDVSTEYEDRQFVTLFLPTTHIHYVICIKHNGNLGLRVELLKACATYSLSNYGYFKAMDGNEVVFSFQENVDFASICQALNSIDIGIHQRLTQELSSLTEFVSETPDMAKASQVISYVQPYNSSDRNKDFSSTLLFQNDETRATESATIDEENGNFSSLEIVEATKISMAESPVVFHSNEILPNPSSDKCVLNSSLDNLDNLEKQNRKMNKASSAVGVVTCNGISAMRNQELCSVQKSSIDDICASETSLQSISSTDMIDESHERNAESKQKKRKSKSAIGPMQKVFVESSSEEEIAPTKRKFQLEEKGGRWKCFSSSTGTYGGNLKGKHELVGQISSQDNDCVSVIESPIIVGCSKKLDDNQKNTICTNQEKKNEFDYDFKCIGDDFVLTPEKSFKNSATQCTPTITENSLNISPTASYTSCNKSTMCSPGVFSGPSSTVRYTLSTRQTYERVTTDINDLFSFGKSPVFKPSNTFRRRRRRRLAFGSPAQKPNAICGIQSELKGSDAEETQFFLDNCNAMQDFGKKISTIFSKKFTELMAKQNSSMKCISRELQSLRKCHLKSSMEMQEQIIAHLKSFVMQFENNIKINLNLQKQQIIRTSSMLDGCDKLLNDFTAMENDWLRNTKNTETDVVSRLSVAKNELLNSIIGAEYAEV